MDGLRLTLSLDEKILLDQLILLQYFHGVREAGVFLPDEVDLAEGASADHCKELELVDRYLGAWAQDVFGSTIVILIIIVLWRRGSAIQGLAVSLLSRHSQVLWRPADASLACFDASIYKSQTQQGHYSLIC